LIRNNVDASGIEVNHNVYLEGAGPFPNQDDKSALDALKTNLAFKKEDHSITLKLNLPPAVLERKRPLITSKFIGRVPLADMFMEKPDGTPLNIMRDYFGKSIDPEKVLPGPIQNIKIGENIFKVWPKKTSRPAQALRNSISATNELLQLKL